MAICVVLDAVGAVVQQAVVPLAQCSGFVLLDKADWTQYGLVQSLITIPSGADFAAAWMVGFTVPAAVGLIAYCAGRICAMWDS